MVAEMLVGIWMCFKRPEAIQIDIIAKLQCHASHHDTSAKACGAKSLAAPKFCKAGQVVRVRKYSSWATAAMVL